jgi:cytochrome c biogenesis protein ResB
MSRHIMKSPDDLDEFEGGQASLTREMDRDKGSNVLLVKKVIEALSLVQTVIRMTPLEIWQRAAYEAHRLAVLCGKTPERLTANALWKLVEYYQGVLESADVAIHDPEIRECVKSIGEKLGIDILGDIDRNMKE